ERHYEYSRNSSFTPAPPGPVIPCTPAAGARPPAGAAPHLPERCAVPAPTLQYVPCPHLRPSRPSIVARTPAPGPPPVAPAPRRSGRWLALDALFDRAEDAAAIAVEHLDPHQIAERQERGHRLPARQRLDRTPFGQARGAGGGVLVGDG